MSVAFTFLTYDATSSSVIGSAEMAPLLLTDCCTWEGMGDSASSVSSGDRGVALDSRACSWNKGKRKVKIVFRGTVNWKINLSRDKKFKIAFCR